MGSFFFKKKKRPLMGSLAGKAAKSGEGNQEDLRLAKQGKQNLAPLALAWPLSEGRSGSARHELWCGVNCEHAEIQEGGVRTREAAAYKQPRTRSIVCMRLSC
jgi:hypothetical protein